jgi:coenzyme F420 hydrogenase subunit beta
MTESRELYESVIRNDYCIGCGACASLTDSPFNIQMNEFGNIIAKPVRDIDKSNISILNICPFSGYAKNEDELSEIFFPKIKQKDAKIGKYLDCFAGYANEGKFREKGSSGGLGKWLGYHLLKEKRIDYFVQVISNQTNDPTLPLFDYIVTSDYNGVIMGSKSAYYPVTLVDVIKIIKKTNGRYAITGVPCFIKALRILSCEDEILKTRIKYTLGIICGGMKSANQAKIISWQLGVQPENLVNIDFRRKYKDKPASNKIYQVWSCIDNIERFKDAGDIYATDWGAGFFKPNPCDYCDDIVAETADISLGDAWLPQFDIDPRGTNIVIVRNADIHRILIDSNSNKIIALQKLSPEDIIISQEGGFRHRREALSFRIAKKEASNSWYPKKRLIPGQYKITRNREKVYSLREKISRQSHISSLKALNSKNIKIFYEEMNPLIKKYDIAIYGRLPVRILRKIRKKISHKFKMG